MVNGPNFGHQNRLLGNVSLELKDILMYVHDAFLASGVFFIYHVHVCIMYAGDLKVDSRSIKQV